MRRLLTVLLLILIVTLPAAADKAKSAYNQGKDAEARENWDQAYTLYKQAFELKPKEVRYRTALYRARFQAASLHVHRGVLLRENGNLEEALAEFQRAAEIDPALDSAQQEVRKTRDMIEKTRPKAPPGVATTSDLGEIAATAEGPAELKPISNTPITLRMTEDTKVIYTTLGKLAGINVIFDPDYVSRRIPVELNNVSLYQALEIVALESKTFWRPVTSNTIYIASDTKTKRTEVETNVVKTFYLSNAYTTTDVQDTVNTIRTLTDITRLVPLPSQSAIVVRGSPDQVALAEKIINDVDKARPEVVVDVAVMQVSRDKLRNLGISPPTSASATLAPNVTTTTTPSTTTGGTQTGGTTTTPATTPQLNLNKLANLTSNDFQITIPQASVNFLFTDSNTKLIQNPEVRSLNGLKATLKIGDRVPVATGSFGSGIGSVGVGYSPLVNTQFQYIDVGVNIDITPTVHLDRSISLKIVMEVSSVSSHVNIGGIDQPVIGQRRIEHEIRLREGEVNLMGGMIEESTLKSQNGWPFLSQIPILKYLFSSESNEKRENEIVFAMTPHIVRGHEISDLNLRAIDVGTANAIELRRSGPSAATPPPATATIAPGNPRVVPATPAGVTSVPPPQPSGAAPAQQQPAQPQAGGSPAILSFDPQSITQATGSTFAVNVGVANAQNIFAIPLELSYDPKMLQLLNVSNGSFLSRDGQPVALVDRPDEAKGIVVVNLSRPPGASGVSGAGTVFTLTFLAKAPGQSMLNITRSGARDPGQNPLPVNGGQAMVTIK